MDNDTSFNSSWNMDVSKITVNDILERFTIPDIIWIGTPCQSYSIAAISHHRKKNEETGNLDPVSDFAKFCDNMNLHVIELIKEFQKLNPNLIYFWENPRGGLRKMTWMKDFPRYTIWYCKYMTDVPSEQRRAKPTDIWTNHPNPKFLPPCHNGADDHAKAPRGSKTGTQGLKGAKERSTYPKLLCEHIVQICEDYCGKENM